MASTHWGGSGVSTAWLGLDAAILAQRPAPDKTHFNSRLLTENYGHELFLPLYTLGVPLLLGEFLN